MENFNTQKDQKKNPMGEYLLKIQLIVSNSEFKDKEQADQYETMESKMEGDKYCRAVNHEDQFESYQYSSKLVYTILMDMGYNDERAMFLTQHPDMIPIGIKNKLLEMARNEFIAKYHETNPYYVMLSGQPYPGSIKKNPEKVLTIPDEFYAIYQSQNVISKDQPVHEMPLKYQELFMNTPYYTQMVKENPDHKYIQYIGSKSIPIHVSRKAKDGDIMKINTNHLSTTHPIFGNVSVEPNLIHLFTNIYDETRKYVYNTLRGDFGDIYANYNSFIRFLTIYMSIGSCMNELMKKSSSMIYINESTANDFFMLYGFPSVIMGGPDMISFLKQFRLILMDKGTNVVYRVKDLVGYEYTDIYTLIMVKQQVFDGGVPVYVEDENGNRVPKQEIVFRRLGTTDDNTSYFKYRDSTKSYPWRTIADGDPRWWNTPEMEAMLNDMNYTLSNSKYIQLSTHVSLTDVFWQCVILLRGLLDNRYETEYIHLSLPINMNGKSEVSVFEAVLILEILMNWNIKTIRGDSLHGDMYLPNGTYNGVSACLDMLFNGLQYYDPEEYPDVTPEEDGLPNPLVPGSPYKISSFNFHIRENDYTFYQSISNMEYIEPDVFLPLLNHVLDREENNIGESLMTDAYSVYQYLEKKLRECVNIHQFRQVTDVFNHLFLVNPNRDWFDEGEINVDEYLMTSYNLSYYELSTLKTFFKQNETDFTVEYDNIEYPISLYAVLNQDVTMIEINGTYPFQQATFIPAFQSAFDTYQSSELLMNPNISKNLKVTYKNVISDKITLDTGNSLNGPKTFEALLFRIDPDMYKYLISLRSTGDSLLLVIRAIVKALESYVNTSLHGLELTALGEENYMDILKQVISYFKSYMVEFTKEEIVYLFDGLFDNGGNSNMLNLYDEIVHLKTRMIPKDSLTLHDASYAKVHYKESDEGLTSFYDEMQVHRRTTYANVKALGYDIYFDTGVGIVQYPENEPADTDKVEFSIYDINGTMRVHIYL